MYLDISVIRSMRVDFGNRSVVEIQMWELQNKKNLRKEFGIGATEIYNQYTEKLAHARVPKTWKYGLIFRQKK